MDMVKILIVENKTFERGVKEVIYIWVTKPSLNKDGCFYLLPAMLMNLLRARFVVRPQCQDYH